MKTEVNAVNDKFSNYDTKTEINELLTPINESLTSASSNIKSLTERINGLQSTTDTLDNYALKTEVNAVNNKFSNYTTTNDLSKNYALKTEVNAVNNKFSNYTTTNDLSKNYALKTEVNAVNDQFNTSISTINTTLTNKADKSSLDTLATNDELTTVDDKVDKLQSSLKALVDQIQLLDRSQEKHLDNNPSINYSTNSEIDETTPVTYSRQRTRAATQNIENERSSKEINDTVVNDVMVDWITTMNDSFNHFEENDENLMNKFNNYYTSDESDNKYATKNDIANNYPTKSSITSSLTDTIGQFMKNELKSVNYGNLAQKYLDCMTFLDSEFNLQFKDVLPANAKYVIIHYYDEGNYAGYVLVIKCIPPYLGTLMIYSLTRNNGTLNDYKIMNNIDVKISHNDSVKKDVLEVQAYYSFIDVGRYDDPIQNSILNRFMYFNIVESDDELAYSDLMGSLMNFGNTYNNDRYIKANYPTKSSLSESFVSIFTEFINHDRTTYNHVNDLKKYLDYFQMLEDMTNFSFKAPIPANSKYLIAYYCMARWDNLSFIVVGDIINGTAKFILFDDKGIMANSNGTISFFNNNGVNELVFDTSYPRVDREEFPWFDDPVNEEDHPEVYNNFKYFKIIESTDELAYGHLMGSLMDLFGEYKLSGYVKTNGNATINGVTTITSATSTVPLNVYSTKGEDRCNINFGISPSEHAYIRYAKTVNTGQSLSLVIGPYEFITSNLNNNTRTIKLHYGSTITGDLTVSGKISSNGSNTVTHYCPIEAGEEISDFKVGKPVFLSGHVYKRIETKRDDNGQPIYKWISSTANDSTDCICSVIIDGSWKEFVGVISDVDEENGCITFVSHGDVLFYVDDANLYQIGDVVLYDGRILDEEYAMTLKIQRSIVGTVISKINEHTLAVFMR